MIRIIIGLSSLAEVFIFFYSSYNDQISSDESSFVVVEAEKYDKSGLLMMRYNERENVCKAVTFFSSKFVEESRLKEDFENIMCIVLHVWYNYR